MKIGFVNYAQHFKGSTLSVNGNNNILKSEPLPQGVPEDFNLSDDDALINYTRAKIKGLIDFERSQSKSFDKDEFTDSIMSKINEGNRNSSDIEMLMELVQDRKLPSSALYLIDSGKVSEKVSEDLDKLYGAYINNENAADVFVPEFSSKEEALAGTKTGEICKIRDEDNVSIKMPDNSMKELFISKDTYLKLFPPVERFTVSQSNKTSDCYLLAPLISLYNNPNTRFKILEMLRENSDGTIDVSYSGFMKDDDGRVKQKGNSNNTVEDALSKISGNDEEYNVSFSAPWMMVLELPMLTAKLKKYESFANRAIAVQQNDFEKLLQSIQQNNVCRFYKYCKDDSMAKMAFEAGARPGESIFYNDEVYTKEEIELFLSCAEKGEPVIALHKDSYEKLHDYPKIKYEDLLKKLDEIKDRTDDTARYERLLIERKIKYLEQYSDTKDASVEITDCIPLGVYFDLFNTDTIPPKIIEDGGSPYNVFLVLGCNVFDCPNTSYYSPNPAKSFLEQDDISKYALVCSTCKGMQKKNNFEIFGLHVYSLEPVYIDGKRMFAVKNPWNSAVEEIFTVDEVLEYFETIISAEV